MSHCMCAVSVLLHIPDQITHISASQSCPSIMPSCLPSSPVKRKYVYQNLFSAINTSTCANTKHYPMPTAHPVAYLWWLLVAGYRASGLW